MRVSLPLAQSAGIGTKVFSTFNGVSDRGSRKRFSLEALLDPDGKLAKLRSKLSSSKQPSEAMGDTSTRTAPSQQVVLP